MKVRYEVDGMLKALGLRDRGYPPQDPSVSWSTTPLINKWPSREGVKAERDYGTPGPQVGQPKAMISSDEVLDVARKAYAKGESQSAAISDAAADKKPTPDTRLDSVEADQLYAAKMAAQFSPLAALGYDDDKITITPRRDKKLTYEGVYAARKDSIWSNMASGPSTPVHESIHRGIELLKKSGSKEANELSHYDNEIVTRAIMLRTFGGLETEEAGGGAPHPQVETAAHNLAKNPKFVKLIETLEQQAAHEGAKKLMETFPGPGPIMEERFGKAD